MLEKAHTYDVIVIGGGASGMMAAGVAAEAGKRVLVLEKNKDLGKKLSISGGGRCNITNAETDIRTFLKSYSTSAEFLYSPFSQFGSKETFEFFENKKLPLKEEARKRVFPKSERAPDVVDTLVRYMHVGNVTIKSNTTVTKILFEEYMEKKKTITKITGVQTTNGTYHATSYIFATGGVSHPETGSTGDGFKWMKELGHTVNAPTPTIVPIRIKDAWVHALAGISIENMKITFYSDVLGVQTKAFMKKGRVLFTHFGLSGPLILNSSKKVADLMHAGQVTAKIDMFPEVEISDLDKKFVELFDGHKNKVLKNVLKDILPTGTTKGIEKIFSNELLETKVHSITKDERRKMVETLKGIPVTVEGLMGFEKAVVADGGVILSEIDMKTMRSIKCENLFVTGDLLHINRPTGGWSLQLCWTTGFVAGKNA